MSSGGESLGVVACIAAVISAFRDADINVQSLRTKRMANQAHLPPSILEESIAESPKEIEREKRRGVERHGKTFERGDHVAVIAIQQITIDLRTNLLEQLRYATNNDEVADFTDMIDLADAARDNTVAALIALRKRLMQAGTMFQRSEVMPSQELRSEVAPARPPTSPPMRPSRQFSSLQPTQNYYTPPMQPYQPHLMQSYPLSPSQSYREPSHRNLQNSPAQNFGAPTQQQLQQQEMTVAGNVISVADETHHNSQRRHNPLLGFWRRNPTRFGSPDNHSQFVEDVNRNSLASPTSFTSNRSASRHPGSPMCANTLVEVEEDPFDAVSRHSSVQEVERNNTRSSVATDQSISSSIRSTPATTISSVSSPSVRIPSHITILTLPAPDNNFLGFCKGAWKAQNDDPKAMIERMDFTKAANSKVAYPSCSKCAFKGHQYTTILKNKVWKDEERCINYRWAFLAKSHVKQKSVTDRNYSVQCVFCTLMGIKDRVVYNESSYLDHVSQEHRWNELDAVVLHRTRCITDRMCKDTEKFDINFFPLSVNEREYARNKQALSEDFGIGMPTPELAG